MSRPRRGPNPTTKIPSAHRLRRSSGASGTTPGAEFGRLLLVQAAGSAGTRSWPRLAGSLFFGPGDHRQGRVGSTRADSGSVRDRLPAPVAVSTTSGGACLAMLVSSVARGTLAGCSRRARLLVSLPSRSECSSCPGSLVVRGAALPNLVAEGGRWSRRTRRCPRPPLCRLVAGIPGPAGEEAGPHLEVLVAGRLSLGRDPACDCRRRKPATVDERLGARSSPLRVGPQALVAMAGLRFLAVPRVPSRVRAATGGLRLLGWVLIDRPRSGLIGAIVAPRLKRALKEEGIVVVSLVWPACRAVVASGSLYSMRRLVFASGHRGTARSPSTRSSSVRCRRALRGWAFARFEPSFSLRGLQERRFRWPRRPFGPVVRRRSGVQPPRHRVRPAGATRARRGRPPARRTDVVSPVTSAARNPLRLAG